MTAEKSLFISYSHTDMSRINWLERLKLYLAPIRRAELIDIWDDTRIGAGSAWRAEIQKAMDCASAVILLVGPGFIASPFIQENELPMVLKAAQTRGIKFYPVVVGYCAYKGSALEPYQSFNDPDQPLEALSDAEQNKALNAVSVSVDRDMRQARAVTPPAQPEPANFRRVFQLLRTSLGDTGTAYDAQAQRRDSLIDEIEKRLHVKEEPQYEIAFFRYFPRLNREEKFEFDLIRAITEGSLYPGNRKTLEIIEKNPEIMEEIPEITDLRQHLVFWLNKYELVFSKRPDMCVCYAGVEDGVPFPEYLDLIIDNWLASHP